MPTDCKTCDWGCIYHACMSDHCQRSIMTENDGDFGPGNCEKNNALGGIVKPIITMNRIPKLGDVVIYTTTKQEQEDMGNCPPLHNNVAEKLPAIVTAVWSDSLVNLKVIHDGQSEDLWKTSISRGKNEFNWDFNDPEEKEEE